MDELSDLFELMHGAPASFRTLRAVIRDRCDYEPTRRSWAASLEEADPEGWAGYLAEGGRPGEGCCWNDMDYTTRLWIERPGRLREDTELWGGQVTVNADAGASPLPSAYAELLDPLTLVPALQLSPGGEETVAGRAGFLVHAEPRDPDGYTDHFSPLTRARADRAELVIDLERGLLLRKTILLEGEPIQILEFTELEFDASLDPELWVSPPPPEPEPPAELTPPGEPEPPAGMLTVEQAAARVPFTVFALPTIWPRAHFSIHLFGGMVWLSYSDHEDIRSGSPARQISIRQQGRPHETWMPEGPADIDLDGVEALAWVGDAQLDAGKISYSRSLRLARDGTHLELEATGIGREEFLGLARSLIPARSEPPRLNR